MRLTYEPAAAADIEPIYQCCIRLIWQYEDLESVDLSRVLPWVRRKLEARIGEYTRVLDDGHLVAYYHFAPADGKMELDDLYVLSEERRGQGLGTAILEKCFRETEQPIFLYVFQKNTRAVALYTRLGFRITETIGSSRYIMQRSPQ